MTFQSKLQKILKDWILTICSDKVREYCKKVIINVGFYFLLVLVFITLLPALPFLGIMWVTTIYFERYYL